MNSDQYNKVASSTPFIVAYVTVDHDGASIKNTYDVLLNGKIAVSNTTHNTSVKVNPTKSVLDQKNEDINGTNVLVGDTLKYSMTWDLSDMAGTTLSSETSGREFSFSDDFDETKVDVDKDLITVLDGKGNDVTKQFNVQ
ncbi:SspB-related isopeptide-forming adhesin, partial [Ligilactobacillus equi]|uniref:SspB-related isopeptide-forming adhesin n=1 Tax=Ligilactobacillus equi TaxID=137357 RepID=UPI0034E1EC3B